MGSLAGEAGLVGALNLDGTHGEPALPTPSASPPPNGAERKPKPNGVDPVPEQSRPAQPTG